MGAQFNKSGYYHKKSFLTTAEKFSLLNLLKNSLSKYMKIKSCNSFEDIKLHKSLIKFRKNNPKLFGEMYNNLNLNSQLRSIFYRKKFINLFSKLLNTNINSIYLNGFMWRIDVPYPIDKRNLLGWHQDGPYYQMCHPKYNSGFCTISITNNTKKNGTVSCIAKSHLNGYYKVSNVKQSDFRQLRQEQFKIKINSDEEKNIVNLDTNTGDIVCYHLNIKHKGGINETNKARMSILCRFHDMNSTFNSGKELYIFSKNKKSNLF